MSQDTKTLKIEIEYTQGSADWDKRPVAVTIDGEESTLSEAQRKVLNFQQHGTKTIT